MKVVKLDNSIMHFVYYHVNMHMFKEKKN